MSTAAIEDKKTVTLHEAKARELQVKINALLSIEKVDRADAIHDLLILSNYRIFVVV